jgi:uncharacterized protein YecT (DUF1311 family)
MKIKSKIKLVNAIAICILMLFLNNKVYSQSRIDCSKATNQLDLNICLQKQYAATDRELIDLYKKVSAKLDAQQRSILIQSQKRWISFRDEYAKIYELIYKGGSIAPSVILQCKIELTKTRITELQTLFEQISH